MARNHTIRIHWLRVLFLGWSIILLSFLLAVSCSVVIGRFWGVVLSCVHTDGWSSSIFCGCSAQLAVRFCVWFCAILLLSIFVPTQAACLSWPLRSPVCVVGLYWIARLLMDEEIEFYQKVLHGAGGQSRDRIGRDPAVIFAATAVLGRTILM